MKRRIVTISREYGSGGQEIGSRVAKELGIAFYDKQLIALAAKESGFSLSFVEENEESKVNSLLYNLAMTGAYARSVYTGEYLSPNDQVYVQQNRIIRELADKAPCVLVGRSSDYILRERTDCLHVFIHADLSYRADRAVRVYGVNEKDVEKELQRKDKARSSHYRYYTGRIWGMAQNYHLCLNSGVLGPDACVKHIVELIQES